MASICDRIGKDDVLEGFDFYMADATPDKPLFYSVWNGQKLKHISREDDPEAARQQFATLLDVWERSDTGGMLECRFHEKQPNGTLSNKSEYVGSMTFRMRPYGVLPLNGDGAAPAARPGSVVYQPPVDPMTQFLAQLEMFQKIQALMSPAVPAGVGADKPDIWDRIDTLLEKPIVEDAIAGFLKTVGMNMDHYGGNARAMAGDNTPDDETEVLHDMADVATSAGAETERLQAVLIRLSKGERDFIGLLEKLADLKEKSPAKYNMAKMML